MKQGSRGFTPRIGTGSGCRRERPRSPSQDSIRRCRMLWLMQPCSSDWPIKATTFRRASSRRLKRLPRSKRLISKNGGRSSRPRTSRENKSGSRLAFQGSNMMKLPHRRQFLHLAAGAAALPTVSRFAWAQAYPSRPVRIVASFAPAGSSDIVARLMGQWLSERLGQPFIIENRPGSGGNIGTEAVVRASPDGYTLLVIGGWNAINATLYDKLSFNFIRDIAPVAGINREPYVIVVHPSVSAKTVPEFIAYAKANPGKVTMASGGIGAPSHVSGELFKMRAGVNLVHVPYRGGGPAVTDLLGGQVQVMFAPTPPSI